jgi:hypothetical protein
LYGERAIKTIFIDETCPLLGIGWPIFIESHRGARHQMRERKDGYNHAAEADEFDTPIP